MEDKLPLDKPLLILVAMAVLKASETVLNVSGLVNELAETPCNLLSHLKLSIVLVLPVGVEEGIDVGIVGMLEG